MKIAVHMVGMIGASLAMAQTAQAAVPKISGLYIVSVSNTCQESIKATKSGGGNVTDISKNLTGQFEETIAKATFTLSTHVFAYTGTRVQGDNMLIFGKGGLAIVEGPDVQPSSAYSNDATTVTLAGNIFTVIYGAVTAAGVANSFMFQKKDGNCVTKGIAVR